MSHPISWHIYICKGENTQEMQGWVASPLNHFQGSPLVREFFLGQAWVVWCLKTFRLLEWGGLPPMLKKTMLISEVQALQSFTFNQHLLSSWNIIPNNFTGLAGSFVTTECWHCLCWNLHLFENAPVAKVERWFQENAHSLLRDIKYCVFWDGRLSLCFI